MGSLSHERKYDTFAPPSSPCALKYIEHHVSKLDTFASVAIKYGVEYSDFSTSTTYPTKITSDADTHEDFQPTNKSTGSLLDIVEKDVKESPVMIYMKGLPDAPRCGFSALAVKVLQQYGVPIKARDILGDLKLKESVKTYTNWPTFPQVFIKEEFVEGSDILFNMHQVNGYAHF
ncbi:monothiol glutaredoxin-S4, mitochondrial-like [Zingiber officinale]|uniref:monothiol glutaredoxin-S4, mitochondrial-like n=1 Tax=Zingiber officinale TaxID=94328 RepID=UPI001C4AC843|nr:monothiol glutaredoxin-S4, mitochondrial-like [Zingiber officinale]